jgi:hypothetical protein
MCSRTVGCRFRSGYTGTSLEKTFLCTKETAPFVWGHLARRLILVPGNMIGVSRFHYVIIGHNRRSGNSVELFRAVYCG